MKIDRHNYEEFFLLYVDGELSAEQRASLELFVKENSDLENELRGLLQTKLPDEDVLLIDKSALFKTENVFIDHMNYEELFLLYIDNELTNTEKNKVEDFVIQHPKLQGEFTLLKQSKLEAGTITFPYKKSLYRKESRRVVYVSWQRISIAAALIGLTLILWNVFPTTVVDHKSIAVVTKKSQQSLKSNLIEMPSINKTTERAIVIPSGTSTIKELKSHNRELKNISGGNKGFPEVTPQNKVSKTEDIASLNLPTTANEITNKNMNTNSNNATVQNTLSAQTKNNIIPKANELDKQSLVQNTVYKELDTDEDVKNNKLYIGSLGVNKDKLRGLLKRASHLFDRGDDDEKNIKIASFAVNSKSLK
jgi:hypothetical protein